MPGRLMRAMLACSPLLAAACSSFRTVAPPSSGGAPREATWAVDAVRGADAVRVRFAVPRQLDAVGPAGDTAVMADLAGVGGRLLAVRDDTLYLSADEVYVVGGSQHRWRSTAGLPRRIAVVPAATDELATSRLNVGHVVFGVITAVAVVAAGVVILFLLNPPED